MSSLARDGSAARKARNASASPLWIAVFTSISLAIVPVPYSQIPKPPLHYSPESLSPQERNVSPANTFDPRIDAYIAKSKPFEQPILNHLRELVHKACPGVVEAIKWSRPFFEYKGVILGNMSGFKEHCSFGFWGEEISAALRDAKVLQPDAMGSLGRITRVEDLPPNKQMLGLLRQAVAFIDSGNYTSPITARQKVVKAPAPAPEAPPEF